eukprot:TRINITY_DN462_c0_g1_i7.p2 TRINITY_DN462_c0_g1~~TRINITY_DN462_c0_g1_i7.p2  ORF type:complete len:225 (+),score=36.40 TRINITY_DN462_c0_g1_i7:29-703(+)
MSFVQIGTSCCRPLQRTVMHCDTPTMGGDDDDDFVPEEHYGNDWLREDRWRDAARTEMEAYYSCRPHAKTPPVHVPPDARKRDADDDDYCWAHRRGRCAECTRVDLPVLVCCARHHHTALRPTTSKWDYCDACRMTACGPCILAGRTVEECCALWHHVDPQERHRRQNLANHRRRAADRAADVRGPKQGERSSKRPPKPHPKKKDNSPKPPPAPRAGTARRRAL